MEEGERNSKYFLNLDKCNYNSTSIKKLVDANDKEITDLSEIIEEQKSFYTKHAIHQNIRTLAPLK